MLYNVFDTEQEAIDAELVDYNMFISEHNNPEAYVEGTTKWDEVKQRLDGKWVYQVCEHGIQTHTQEEYNDNWFNESEV